MAYETDGPWTQTTGAAVSADRLLKLSSGTVIHNTAGAAPMGVAGDNVASGGIVTVKPLTGGLRKVTGSKDITAGTAIYAAATGYVSDAAVGKQIGVLLTAITGAGGKGTAVLYGPNGAVDGWSSRASLIDYFDDFFEYDATATVGNWAVVEDAGATEADKLIDGQGGILQIGCDGDDNDECYVSSIAEVALFEADKNLYFEARVKLTEANTDDANIIVGLSDTVAADSLQDDGAGPMASYDGAVFFKVDGGTVWQFESSNAGTQDTETDVGDFDDGEWTVLGFHYDYNDGVTASVTPYVNGVAGTAVDLTIAGLAEMHVVLGVKAGGANEEALLVDYVHVIQERG